MALATGESISSPLTAGTTTGGDVDGVLPVRCAELWGHPRDRVLPSGCPANPPPGVGGLYARGDHGCGATHLLHPPAPICTHMHRRLTPAAAPRYDPCLIVAVHGYASLACRCSSRSSPCAAVTWAISHVVFAVPRAAARLAGAPPTCQTRRLTQPPTHSLLPAERSSRRCWC